MTIAFIGSAVTLRRKLPSRAILLAALLACAALIAVEAAPAARPSKPIASKPPPKPIASKPPPKPVLSKPPPKPVLSKPPPKPVLSKPPPKPVASKPPPKLRGTPPSRPPMHVDPIFCRPQITLYGNVGYSSQIADFSMAACMKTADIITANLTSVLTGANATVLQMDSDCSSGALIAASGTYYVWSYGLEADAGNILAQGWLNYLTSSGLLAGACGAKPAGTQLSLKATISDSTWICMKGEASINWFCS